MSRVVHFEINADDAERAVKFYQDALGWEIKKWVGEQPYWLVTTGPDDQMGINGAITPRTQGYSTVNTVGVLSIDETLAKVAAAGGKVVTDKMDIPGIGTFAYCTDTEGNTFGVLQPSQEMMPEE
jgi:predicted enzyme related to lactoylglutathione lyase